MAADALVVLAKAPARGFSKTRLAQDIGPDAAFRLAEAFLADTLSTAQSVRADAKLLWVSPAESVPAFAARCPWASVFPQPEGDLGARMHAAFGAAFARGAERCVAVGTDSPHIGPARIERALDALRRADVVLGPAHDGGYYLIGLSADRPQIFENVPWSTERVLEVTRARCRARGLALLELEPDLDVDDGDDLARLASALEGDAGLAPASRAALFGSERPD